MKAKPIKTNNTMKATKLNTVANTYANNLKCLFHTECINISHYDEYTEVSLRLTRVIKMDSFRFAVHSIAKSYGVKAEVIGNGMNRDIRITIDEEYEANLLMREGELDAIIEPAIEYYCDDCDKQDRRTMSEGDAMMQ